MNSEYIIETKGLKKAYDGGQEVLSGLDLRVPRGSVYGFLGRNGTGKTTTIRILMGLLRWDVGRVEVLGESSFKLSVETRQRIGYVSQEQTMFEWMTIEQLVAFTSSFYPTWDADYTQRLRKKLDLPSARPLGALSSGQQQKAALLLALAQRPDLLILDEPAASLDTVVRREFLESILDVLTDEGITVLISSQILTDVERIADWIGILSDGRMLLSEPLEDLKESIKRLRIRTSGRETEIEHVPGAIRTIRRGSEALVTVQDFSPTRLEEIRALFPDGVDVQDVDLEDIFIDLVS